MKVGGGGEALGGQLWRLTPDGQILGEPIPFLGGEVSWGVDGDDAGDDLVTIALGFPVVRWQLSEPEFWAILGALIEPEQIAAIREEIYAWDTWESEGGSCFD